MSETTTKVLFYLVFSVFTILLVGWGPSWLNWRTGLLSTRILNTWWYKVAAIVFLLVFGYGLLFLGWDNN